VAQYRRLVMLSIRKDQVDEISASFKARHRKLLLRFFRNTLARAVAHLDDAALLTKIDENVTKAKVYGICGGGALVKFVRIGLLVGADFADHPAVRTFFKMPDLDPDFKMELLEDLISRNLQTRTRPGP